MKANSTVAKITKVHKFEPLPDPPVSIEDIPNNLPIISQSEIIAYSNAEMAYRLAKADFEMKRAGLTLKLLQLCKQEPGSVEARLDEDGRLIKFDRSSSGYPLASRS